MQGTPNIARIGALTGDNTRASMLSALMHGKALTANELARTAGISAQTASTHLARLVDGGLLVVRKQGRHKYFSLAGADVAALLESMMSLAALAPLPIPHTGPTQPALCLARVCYNHLAGDLGVTLYDGLLDHGWLVRDDDGLRLTDIGSHRVTDWGIDLQPLRAARSPLCRECLDWSERRSHLAGGLGRAFLARFEVLGWLKRDADSRALHVSAQGRRGFDRLFQA